MFTGIIEELGQLVSRTDAADSSVIEIRGPLVTTDAEHGSSIAVNGVCLTVTALAQDRFSADVVAETLARSSLGTLEPGDVVNLERPMRADGRFGGHIVQGHVDATTRLVSRTPGERWEVVRLELPGTLAPYVVEKGSVALDGVSLTVSAVGPDWFEVSLIPTTLELTTLGSRAPGEQVNVEVDVLAKYVERMLAVGSQGSQGSLA